MSKAKYKVGNLVAVKNQEGFDEIDTYGRVSAVITTGEGYFYRVDSREFAENEINAAFREIKARVNKTSIQRARSKSKKKNDEATVN